MSFSLTSPIVALFSLFTASPEIILYNTLSQKLYCAPYYSSFFQRKVFRADDIVELQAGCFCKIQRPGYKIGHDRNLLVSSDSSCLKELLTQSEYAAFTPLAIGLSHGNEFYIAEKNGVVTGFSKIEWKSIDSIFQRTYEYFENSILNDIKIDADACISCLPESLHDEIKGHLNAFDRNLYKNDVCYVRMGNELCAQEKKALAARAQTVQKALAFQFNKPIPYTPKIALVTSGGGYRALIMTLGFLAGMEQTGLLDTISWVSSLSGSTWAIGTWLSYAQKIKKESGSHVSVQECRSLLFDNLSDKKLTFPLGQHEIEYLNEALLTRFVTGQPITLINIYGGFLANRLLSFWAHKRHQLYLSQQQDLDTGAFPIPLYTAVHAENSATRELPWFEFSPWEVGSCSLSCYVPSWGFGRKFNNGKSIDYELETSLGVLFGIFGSAFAATIGELYETVDDYIQLKFMRIFLQKAISQIQNKRIVCSKIHNFARGIGTSPSRNNEYLTLIDAGLDFNLPYPPISGERPERLPDIMIFFDASFDIKGDAYHNVPSLREVENYAITHNLKFPIIDYEGIDTRIISIFKDVNPEVPTVIYMPRINNSVEWKHFNYPEFAQYKVYLENFDIEECVNNGYAHTFNFEYTKTEMKQLSSLAEFNVLIAQKQIYNEIEQCIMRKRK